MAAKIQDQLCSPLRDMRVAFAAHLIEADGGRSG